MSVGQKAHIFIATPCYGGMVTQTYMQSVLALVTEAARQDLLLSIALLGQDALITRSRNTLVAQFMRSPATHLMFIDSDIGFNPSDIFDLLQSEKDVVGALYPLRASRWTTESLSRLRAGEPLSSASLDYVGEPFGELEPNGLIRCKYAGTGFLLISRPALMRMIANYPETRCKHAHVLSSDTPLEIFALFDCSIEPETNLYIS